VGNSICTVWEITQGAPIVMLDVMAPERGRLSQHPVKQAACLNRMTVNFLSPDTRWRGADF
jgi:hypothetical protein